MIDETESQRLATYYARKLMEREIVARAFVGAVTLPKAVPRGSYRTVAEIPPEEKAEMLKRIHLKPRRKGRNSLDPAGRAC